MEKKLGKNQPRTNPENFQDASEFSPRSPAYKPPHVAPSKTKLAVENSNIDLKLKLLKEEIFKELALQLVVDGGDLDA